MHVDNTHYSALARNGITCLDIEGVQTKAEEFSQYSLEYKLKTPSKTLIEQYQVLQCLEQMGLPLVEPDVLRSVKAELEQRGLIEVVDKDLQFRLKAFANTPESCIELDISIRTTKEYVKLINNWLDDINRHVSRLPSRTKKSLPELKFVIYILSDADRFGPPELARIKIKEDDRFLYSKRFYRSLSTLEIIAEFIKAGVIKHGDEFVIEVADDKTKMVLNDIEPMLWRVILKKEVSDEMEM